jgi:ribosomal protein S12 methylthiotransferase
MAYHTKKKLINLITMGCSKNLVDSEKLMGQLEASGFQLMHDSSSTSAKTVIINTCGFIRDAKVESIDTILQFAKAKIAGTIDNLYVIGCLSERYKTDLITEIPEVDQFFGVNSVPEILKELGAELKNDLLGSRKLTTPAHYAYLKVSEGCDRTCAFCAIPYIRGKHISRPVEELIVETKQLASKGVKELILIAQDLTYYGIDLYKSQKIAFLVNKLSEIEGIEWIRLHYTYPNQFPIDLISEMRDNSKVCKYLDIPLQHITNNMLFKMRRSSSREDILELMQKLRKEIPNLALRTTLLTGFPGESEDDFNALKEFVSDIRFDRLGVFPYSHEENTHAYRQYEDNIPDKTKNKRVEELMSLQQNVSLDNNLLKVGKVFKVIIDREDPEYYIGRTEFDSPEVDNEVLIEKLDSKLKIGHFYNIAITGATEHDLYGKKTGK